VNGRRVDVAQCTQKNKAARAIFGAADRFSLQGVRSTGKNHHNCFGMRQKKPSQRVHSEETRQDKTKNSKQNTRTCMHDLEFSTKKSIASKRNKQEQNEFSLITTQASILLFLPVRNRPARERTQELQTQLSSRCDPLNIKTMDEGPPPTPKSHFRKDTYTHRRTGPGHPPAPTHDAHSTKHITRGAAA